MAFAEVFFKPDLWPNDLSALGNTLDIPKVKVNRAGVTTRPKIAIIFNIKRIRTALNGDI